MASRTPTGDNGPVTTPDPGTTRSFAEVLTEAIQARGLSLERIRARLDAAGVPVSIATLSYWQSGRSFPTRARSYHTLVELEAVLNLTPGYLTSLTHTADGRTRRELFEWQKVVPVADLVTGIIADLGIEMQGQLSRVMTNDMVTIGPDHAEIKQVTSTVFRAERSGQHRWAQVLRGEGDLAESPGIKALFGCQVGEVVTVPERQLTVAEMLAPRPLQRGELLTTDVQISWPASGVPSFRIEKAIAEPMRGLGLVVKFHPDTDPVSVYAGYRPEMGDADDGPVDRVEVPLALHEAQHVRLDVKPGVYGLYWSWE